MVIIYTSGARNEATKALAFTFQSWIYASDPPKKNLDKLWWNATA